MKSRKLLIISVLVFALVFLTGSVFAASVKLPRTFEGKEISVYLVAENRSSLLKENVSEFEEETGIKVNITTLPYPNLQEKQFLNLTQGSGPDVVHVDQVWLGQYENYLVPIEKYINDPELTDKDKLKLNDIVPTILKLQNSYNNKLLGFPFIGAIRMIYYRTDLFEEYADEYKSETGMSLQPPATWQEYKRIARFFEENVEGVHGTTIMGRRGVQLFCEVMPILWSFGGEVLEGPEGQPVLEAMEDIKPNINSPEAIEALKYFKSLTKYASNGVTDWDWDESATAFAKGNAALAMQWNNAAPVFSDEEESRIIGKWAAAVVPGHPGKAGLLNRAATFGGWNLGINKNSDNKKAAYLFIKWATSQEMDKKLAAGGGNARYSTFHDTELSKKYTHYDATFKSYGNVRSRPRIPELSEVADIAQTAFSQILTEQKTVEKALNDAQSKLEDIF